MCLKYFLGRDYPVAVSKFEVRAREVEVDAVTDQAEIVKERIKKPWVWALMAFALGCLTAFVLVEALVLLFYGEQAKSPRHVVEAPWGLRYNDPGSEYRHRSADGTWWFRINRQGMRDDRDFSYRKPDGVRRIISLGDSYTIGYEVDVDQTFSAVLERELRKAGHEVEVLNAGVSGFSNAEQALYLERELMKYDPDVVVLSFYYNDVIDNVRTGLFQMKDGNLQEAAETYIPAGRVGNFLNSSWFFNLLSERSNSFVLTKELATHILKAEMVRANQQVLREDQLAETARDRVEDSPGTPSQLPKEPSDPKRELADAIFQRIYEQLRQRRIPFIIQSIPTRTEEGLVDSFLALEFDLEQPGLYFVSMRDHLAPYVGREQLHWKRSHNHWTPFAHDQSGRALANLIVEEQLLEPETQTIHPADK